MFLKDIWFDFHFRTLVRPQSIWKHLKPIEITHISESSICYKSIARQSVDDSWTTATNEVRGRFRVGPRLVGRRRPLRRRRRGRTDGRPEVPPRTAAAMAPAQRDEPSSAAQFPRRLPATVHLGRLSDRFLGQSQPRLPRRQPTLRPRVPHVISFPERELGDQKWVSSSKFLFVLFVCFCFCHLSDTIHTSPKKTESILRSWLVWRNSARSHRQERRRLDASLGGSVRPVPRRSTARASRFRRSLHHRLPRALRCTGNVGGPRRRLASRSASDARSSRARREPQEDSDRLVGLRLPAGGSLQSRLGNAAAAQCNRIAGDRLVPFRVVLPERRLLPAVVLQRRRPAQCRQRSRRFAQSRRSGDPHRHRRLPEFLENRPGPRIRRCHHRRHVSQRQIGNFQDHY